MDGLKGTFKIPLQRLSPHRISVSFTWDDNSTRHITDIAPLFEKQGFKCTFYIVTGDFYAHPDLLNGYISLLTQGFEIGSHTNSHKHLTKISETDAGFEFSKAIDYIQRVFSCYPLTFAFPYHDYNSILLKRARSLHLETRNTLENSVRYSLKTNTTFQEIKQAIHEAINNKQNIVFSGHSVISKKEYSCGIYNQGYEPFQSSLLEEVLIYLKDYQMKIDVIPFGFAALKEYLKKNIDTTSCICQINEHQLDALAPYGISIKELQNIL